MSFPRSLDQLPTFEDYAMSSRTYRYSNEEMLYPFGFGLSYSRFQFSNLQLEHSVIESGESLGLLFTIANTGSTDAAEVVQVYLTDVEASVLVPKYHLVGFQRIALQASESKNIRFTLTPEMMSFFDEDGISRLEPGEFIIEIGGCSPGTRGLELGAPQPLCVRFTIAS